MEVGVSKSSLRFVRVALRARPKCTMTLRREDIIHTTSFP